MRTYTLHPKQRRRWDQDVTVSWVGNDGTFSRARRSSLPQGKPVTFTVTVNPTTSGIHSAMLQARRRRQPGHRDETMNTVVAAEQFTAQNGYSVTKTDTVDRNQSVSYFFNVPAGTPALKVDLTGGGEAAGAGQIRFLRFHPYGVGIESNSTPNNYNPPVPGCTVNCTVALATSRTTTNPQAGVWEVAVEVRRTSDAVAVPFTLTASILGASISPNPDVIPSATLGVPVARSYTATNTFGPFIGRVVGAGALGSAKVSTETIANLAQQQFPVAVAAGSTSLRATIGSPSDPAADLDLFVYRLDPSVPSGAVLVGQSADGDSEESVTIANPVAGTYVVLVDGFSVPAGSTTYKYVDVFTNSAFGSVSVTDANALRPNGASWTVPGTVTANAAPAADRVLLGGVQVRTDGNVLVGSADVIVEAVTP